MHIRVLLLAEDETARRATVASTVEVGADDLRWPERLVHTVARRAQEGAHCLRTHLIPPPAASEAGFVPLADVVPVVA